MKSHSVSHDDELHSRNIPSLPVDITRDEFVEIIFDLGLTYLHGYDTIISAVEIGDRFVEYSGLRTAFINNKSSMLPIMLRPIEQIYSKELAYITTVIAGKSNEDDGYNSTLDAVYELNNCYLYKMEWEICLIFKCFFPVNNFITFVGNILYSVTQSTIPGSVQLSSVFWDISREYCLNRPLMKINHITVLMGMIILYNRNKLNAITLHKKRIFQNELETIAKECEISLDTVIKTYIQIKSE